MSAQFAIAEPRRIKATHRRRRKIAAGHFVQRYYDPAIGRFLSVDPMAVDTKGATNSSRYWYAANNPFRFTDPDGRVQKDENGSVIFVSTGSGTTTIEHYTGIDGTTTVTNLIAELGYVLADDGTKISAFRPTGVEIIRTDSKNNSTRIESDAKSVQEMANCHGTSFASGQVWINSSQVAALISGDGYVSTNNPVSGDIGVYTSEGTNLDSAQHSVTVLTTGANGVEAVGGKNGVLPYQTTSPEKGWPDASQLRYYTKP